MKHETIRAADTAAAQKTTPQTGRAANAAASRAESPKIPRAADPAPALKKRGSQAAVRAAGQRKSRAAERAANEAEKQTENREKVRWLREYRILWGEAQRLEQELERWRSIAEKATPTLSNARQCASPDGGRMERAVEEIDALQRSLAASLARLAVRRTAIETAIGSVPDERLRLLLRYRYVDRLTFEHIAELMELSYQWVFALHGRALCALRLPKPPTRAATPPAPPNHPAAK